MKIIFSSIWLFLFASFNLVVLFNTNADLSAFIFIITNSAFAVFAYIIYAFYYSNIKKSTSHKTKSLAIFFGLSILYVMYQLTISFIKNDLSVYLLDHGRGKFGSEILLGLGQNMGF
jgi:hypothetical protein